MGGSPSVLDPPRRSARAFWRGLNPPASPQEKRKARAAARSVARVYARKGASCVVLAGSWARGDAHRASDLDLWVLWPPRVRARSETLWREPFIVNVQHSTPAGERRKLQEPRQIGGHIPGWREAIPLYDPRGIAARLKSEARAFRWEKAASRCDRWVAESMVGWAEEAIKLVRALAEGNLSTAAVQRNLLVDALGFVMAIHRRTFWGSENEFWERIGSRVGGRWQVLQRQALALDGRDGTASCRAALDLYRETAKRTWDVLGRQEQAIVAYACAAIGSPLRVG